MMRGLTHIGTRFDSTSQSDESASGEVVAATDFRSILAASAMRWLSIESPHSGTGFGADQLGHYPLYVTGEYVQSATSAQSELVDSLLGKFESVDESQLVFGSRMEAARSVFEAFEKNSEELLSALSRLLEEGAPGLCEERRSAAIRYLGVYDVPEMEVSSIVKLLTKVLQNGASSELHAAAMSLRDIGDRGAIPAIVLALEKLRGHEVEAELQKTIDSLVAQHEPS